MRWSVFLDLLFLFCILGACKLRLRSEEAQWGICIKLTSRMQMPLVILKRETLLLLLVANLFLALKFPLNAFGKDH